MTEKAEQDARAQQILADYQDGASVTEVATMNGVSTRWVYVVLKEHGVSREPRRRRRPLSPIHYHIAVLLREDAFDMGLDRASMANKLGWSYQKMASVMQGTSELSILDLQALSTFLKRDYNELMTPKRRNLGVN